MRRHSHEARLEASGDIVVEGGVSATSQAPSDGDTYSAATRTVTNGSAAETLTDVVLAETRPSDGAAEVSPDTRIAIRFSAPIVGGTLNAATVVLRGPDGAVSARIVPAEAGRLLFVTPARALDPGSRYELSIEPRAIGPARSSPINGSRSRPAASRQSRRPSIRTRIAGRQPWTRPGASCRRCAAGRARRRSPARRSG
jgi:hypothetical protein